MGKSRPFQEDFRCITAPNHRYYDVSVILVTTWPGLWSCCVHFNYFLKIFWLAGVESESCFLNIVSTVSTVAPQLQHVAFTHPGAVAHLFYTHCQHSNRGPRICSSQASRSCLPAAAFDIFDEWTGLSDACRPSFLAFERLHWIRGGGSGETEFLPAAYEVLRSSRRIRCTSSGVPPGARALDLYSVLLKEVIAEEYRLLAKCRTLVGRNSVCLRL